MLQSNAVPVQGEPLGGELGQGRRCGAGGGAEGQGPFAPVRHGGGVDGLLHAGVSSSQGEIAVPRIVGALPLPLDAVPPKLTDANARRKMVERGRIVNMPYPGKASLPWPHMIADCGHDSRQSLQEVVYYNRGCQPCVKAEMGRARRAEADPDQRAMMISAGIMPDPDTPFPGTNEPWTSWCLTCGYGKDHGPRWAPYPENVRKGARCPHCHNRRSWTHEEATAYVAAFGVTPGEKYPGTTGGQWLVRCSEGHEYPTTFSRIREKQSSRCRDGAGNKPHSADEALEAFRALGLEPDPAIPYPGYENPWLSTCTRGHRCRTFKLSTVLLGHGCRICNARGNRADPAKLAAELAPWGFSMVDGRRYPGPNKRWPLRHDPCGEVYPRRMAGLRVGFRGCRSCGDQQGGVVRSKPAFVYVLVNVHRDAIKVGLAGHASVYNRIADFESKDWTKYWSMDFATGYDAEAVERSVHTLLRDETGQTPRHGFIPRSDLPNGHSETYGREEIPELYACRLIEEQAVIYADMIQDLQDNADLEQLGLW